MYVYSDVRDPEPLTPGHFITGRRLVWFPSPKSSELPPVSTNQLNQLWKHRQSNLEDFWQRWAKEYLQELRSSRQHKPTAEVNIGDVVLLGDSLQPRQLWKLAE
ncbi:hypothetical protein MTO96_022559 [Rhipicephalus appendiculatus]